MTIYSYIQPYKSRLANVFETAINLNFLLLLTISSTSFFTDDFFLFPSFANVTESTGKESYCTSVEGVAGISWILMPLFYLPVVVAVFTVTILVTHHVRFVYLEGIKYPLFSLKQLFHTTFNYFFPLNFNEKVFGLVNFILRLCYYSPFMLRMHVAFPTQL